MTLLSGIHYALFTVLCAPLCTPLCILVLPLGVCQVCIKEPGQNTAAWDAAFKLMKNPSHAYLCGIMFHYCRIFSNDTHYSRESPLTRRTLFKHHITTFWSMSTLCLMCSDEPKAFHAGGCWCELWPLWLQFHHNGIAGQHPYWSHHLNSGQVANQLIL